MNLKYRIISYLGRIIFNLSIVGEQIDSEKKRKELCRQFKYCSSGVYFNSINQIHCPQYITIGKKTSFGEGVFLTARNSYHCIKNGKESNKR